RSRREPFGRWATSTTSRTRGAARELGNPLARGGQRDEPLQARLPRLFLLGADDPPPGGLAVRQGRRLPERPRLPVLPEPSHVRHGELVAALLVRVDPRT